MLTSLIRWPDSTLKSRLEALARVHRRSLHAELLVALERHVELCEPAASVPAGAATHMASVRAAAYGSERTFKPDFKKSSR